MDLNRAFISVIVFFGLFTMLISTLPLGFQKYDTIEASSQDKEAVVYFDMHNVTMYNQTLSENITHGNPLQVDFGLPQGQKLEFWWKLRRYYDAFQVRHLTGKTWWWWNWHHLSIPEPYKSNLDDPYYDWELTKEDVVTNLFDEEAKACYVEFRCDHITLKLFISTVNETWTLEESWDNHELQLFTSYDVDLSETGANMWVILGQLLAFQTPTLGVPGLFGSVVSTIVSLTLWVSIAIMFYAVITSLIPFVSGWRGK